MIRDSDPARFVKRIQVAIDAGSVVTSVTSRIEWLGWYWVRVYTCILKVELPEPKLLLTFGPVREQTPPDLME